MDENSDPGGVKKKEREVGEIFWGVVFVVSLGKKKL